MPTAFTDARRLHGITTDEPLQIGSSSTRRTSRGRGRHRGCCGDAVGIQATSAPIRSAPHDGRPAVPLRAPRPGDRRGALPGSRHEPRRIACSRESWAESCRARHLADGRGARCGRGGRLVQTGAGRDRALESRQRGRVGGRGCAVLPCRAGEQRLGQPRPHRHDDGRVEVFVDDPYAFVARAVTAGADGSGDPVRDHEMPWGTHRQGGFFDPFGHLWLVGDKSPLKRLP